MKTVPVCSMLPDADLLGEVEARATLLAQIAPLPPMDVPLLVASNRFAAREIRAVRPLPPFDNSAMDGYAVALPPDGGPLPAGTKLQVQGEQAAGPDLGLRIEPGRAIRIFTGAPVPAGTGAVVMQEDVERRGDEIRLLTEALPGEFIRRAGGDLTPGQSLFPAGARLTPARLGLLASQGWGKIAAGGIPSVAVLATGDELRASGEPLGPGEIYESNGVMLAALTTALGANVTLLESARDSTADLDAKLAWGLDQYDVLIVTGGVSVGEKDLVKARLAAAGVDLRFWRVRIQPGKPFLYGQRPGTAERPGGSHVFGLPGNPVSSFVTFLLFVRPALFRLMGASGAELDLRQVMACAGEPLSNRGSRPHYLRGTLDAAGRFYPVGRQESHALFALSRSQVLARIEPGATLPTGSPFPAFLWDC